MNAESLPIPPHFDAASVGKVWRVPYQQRAAEAEAWARQQRVPPAASDRRRVCLMLVDCQNTFCISGFELFVAGRSATARWRTTSGCANSFTTICR